MSPIFYRAHFLFGTDNGTWYNIFTMKKNFMVLLLFTLLITGCIPLGKDKTEDKTPVAIKPDNYITVVSSMGLGRTRELAQAFANQTGIVVQIEELPAEPLSLRLQFMGSQVADIWLGGTAEEYYQADKRHLLQSYQPAAALLFPAEIKGHDNRWTPISVDYVALLSNKKRIRQLHIVNPETIGDLLQPVLHKDIVMARPESGGASFRFITSIWQWRGKERALEYAGKLRTQEINYVLSDMDATLAVHDNHKAVAVVPLSYAKSLAQEHLELVAAPLQDCNAAQVTGAALLMAATNPAGARLFVDFLLSLSGQNILRAHGLMAPGEALVYSGEKIPLIHTELAWTSDYKEEIINAWLNAR